MFNEFPLADPNDPETVKEFKLRLKEARSELAEYHKFRGTFGYYVKRGFVGEQKQLIKELETWLSKNKLL